MESENTRLRRAVAEMKEYGLLERLLGEQCHVDRHRDDDAEEGKVPIALKEPKEVRSSSMQTPHDPEVTYSGHKGNGWPPWSAPSTSNPPPMRYTPNSIG